MSESYNPTKYPSEGGGSGSIECLVWEDINGSGLVGNHEKRIADAAIVLQSTTSDLSFEAKTDDQGNCRFDNVPDGEWYVFVKDGVLPADYSPTVRFDVDSKNAMCVEIDGDKKGKTVKLGFRPPVGSIGDRVWFDQNEDGTQNDGEMGIPGVIVWLKDKYGKKLGSRETDRFGDYRFLNLREGEYIVSVDETTLPGYVKAAYELDEGLTHGTLVKLEPEQNINTVDFGYGPALGGGLIVPPIVFPWPMLLRWARKYWYYLLLGSILSLLAFIWIFYVFPPQDNNQSPRLENFELQLVNVVGCDDLGKNNPVTSLNINSLIINDGGARSADDYRFLINGEALSAGTKITELGSQRKSITIEGIEIGESAILVIEIQKPPSESATAVQDVDRIEIDLGQQVEGLTDCEPDLTLSLISACLDGNRPEVIAYIWNLQGGEIDIPFDVELNDQSFTIDSLAEGEYHILTSDIGDGQTAVRAAADISDAIAESNEDNNSREIEVDTSACSSPPPNLPDLQIQVEAECIKVIDKATLKITITNKGLVAVNDSFILSINGTDIEIMDNLDSGKQIELEQEFDAGRFVSMFVDSKGEIAESDESNNFYSLQIKLCVKPTLQDLSIELNQTVAEACSNIAELSTSVSNNGANMLEDVLVTIGDQEYVIESVAPSESVVITSEVVRQNEPFEIEAAVDADNKIPEEDETNNTVSTEITPYNGEDCLTDADLFVSLAPFCSADHTSSAFDLIAQVTNGGKDRTDAFMVTVNGEPFPVAALNAGESRQIKASFPADTTNFIALVDSANVVPEKDETNNWSYIKASDFPDAKCSEVNDPACTRFNMDIGRNRFTGSPGPGTYVMSEVGGKRISSWYAQNGWLDSGWIRDIEISFESVYVEVEFYSDYGGDPVRLEIINHAPDSEFGWLTRGMCHAIEIEFPQT